MDVNGTHIDIKGAVGKKLLMFREMCVGMASEMETYAQDTAGWTDRTGDARRMLKGYVIDDGESLGIGIVHRAKDEDTGDIYGKYLEGWDKNTQTLTHKGKYPILKEAADEFKDEFFRKAREAFGGGGGS